MGVPMAPKPRKATLVMIFDEGATNVVVDPCAIRLCGKMPRCDEREE